MELIFDEILRLYNLELYEDVILLFEVCANDLSTLKKQQSAILIAMAGNSYFHCGNYAASQQAFYRALRMAKALPTAVVDPKFCEVELKYRLHCCLMRQNKREEAMGVLGSIPEQDLVPKVKAALARLHSLMDVREQKTTPCQATSNAVLFHKQVVEDCPFALHSLSCVLCSGIRIENTCKWTPTVAAWIEAQNAICERNYPKAISILDKVNNNNLRLLVEIGRLHFVYGERQKAASYLQRAHNMDSSHPYSMDILAYIYAQDHKLKELETLGSNLMRTAETPEAYIAYGFLAKSQAKHDTALFFAEKACMLSELQMQSMAMLLKALVFIEKRNYDEAVKHLRDALLYDPLNYDLYETLVQAYSEQRRPNEARYLFSFCYNMMARLTATYCRNHLGQDNARALYLCAKVAAKNDIMIKEAQAQLEKAVSSSPHLLDAVFLLVELYDKTKYYEKAINLLKKQTEITVDSRIHRLLGDFLAKTSQLEAACDQYKFNRRSLVSSCSARTVTKNMVLFFIYRFEKLAGFSKWILDMSLMSTFDADSTSAINSLEGLVGISTPEALSVSPSCPAAPRKRGGAHPDPNSAI